METKSVIRTIERLIKDSRKGVSLLSKVFFGPVGGCVSATTSTGSCVLVGLAKCPSKTSGVARLVQVNALFGRENFVFLVGAFSFLFPLFSSCYLFYFLFLFF